MPTYIALLRAVNLAGRNQVVMSDLRDLLCGLGLEEPRTLLQSGNAIFRGPRRSTTNLEHLLEAELERRLKLKTQLLIRTLDEWHEVIARNPFADVARKDPGHLLVMPFKSAPTEAAVKGLQAAIAGWPEKVRVVAREGYLVYPDGVGRSRLTTALIEKKLGTSGTGRNWNTVLKLQAMAG